MPSPSSPSESFAVVDPPGGWSNDEVHLLRDYYWVDEPDSLRDVLQDRYNLSGANPIWARDPTFGAELFIFRAKNAQGQWHFYLWNGLEDRVSQLVEDTLPNIKSEIVSRGEGKGYLKGVKTRAVQ